MWIIITVAVVLTCVGFLVAIVCGTSGWSSFGYPQRDPNLFGCLIFFVGLTTLAVVGLMVLGKWLL